MPKESDKIKEFIELNIRPKVQADGGEIRFVSLVRDRLTVKMQGECAICHLTTNCLKDWIEKEIEREFGKVIKVSQIVEKAYFADK